MNQRLDYAKIVPAGMKALAGVGLYVQTSGLAPTLVDLVYLRISQINGCAYCIDKHSHDLLKAGVSNDKLILLPVWREAPELFDLRERAALAWAESLTLVAQTNVPDADYHAAAEVFTEKELADLTIAVGLMNLYNRIAISFRAEPHTVYKTRVAGTSS